MQMTETTSRTESFEMSSLLDAVHHMQKTKSLGKDQQYLSRKCSKFFKQKKVLQKLFQQSELIHRKYTMPDMTRRNQASRVESRNQDNPLHSRNPTPNLRMDLCVTNAKCDSCQMVGHYSKCCIKTGKLKKPPNTWKQHISGAH